MPKSRGARCAPVSSSAPTLGEAHSPSCGGTPPPSSSATRRAAPAWAVVGRCGRLALRLDGELDADAKGALDDTGLRHEPQAARPRLADKAGGHILSVTWALPLIAPVDRQNESLYTPRYSVGAAFGVPTSARRKWSRSRRVCLDPLEARRRLSKGRELRGFGRLLAARDADVNMNRGLSTG